MHSKEAADAVARAVGVIKASLPERGPRHGVELRAAGAFREYRQCKRDVALKHSGETVLHFRCWLSGPYPDRAGYVSGAVQILPAAIDQIDAVGFNRAVACFVNFVMAMRAIGTSRRNCVERQIVQHAGILAEGFQPRCRRQFVQSTLMRRFGHPVQEAAKRCAVTRLRRAMTGLLDMVFNGLWQNCRVARFDDRCAAILQCAEYRRNGTIRIHGDALAVHGFQCRNKLLWGAQAHGITQMRADVISDLFRGNKQVRRAIGMGQHKAERDGRIRHIGATDIQEPCH